MKTIIRLGVLTAILLTLTKGVLCADSVDPVFWNKLGSIDEITNSDAGPAVEIFGTPIFESAQFDNGVYFETETEYLRTTSDILPLQKGCVEFWWRPHYDYNNQSKYYNCRFWGSSIGVPGPSPYGKIRPGGFYNYENSSFAIQILFTDNSGSNYVLKHAPAKPFYANDLVHIAYVWDVDTRIEGQYSLAMYQDGELIGAWNDDIKPDIPLTCETPYLRICNFDGNTTTGWDGVKGSMDNFKIYNYAKTDFSDRFYEDGVIPVAEDKLLLWNKAGSDIEVADSKIGASGIISGEVEFKSGKFGNGFYVDASYFRESVKFSNSEIFSSLDRGSIEMWVKTDYDVVDGRPQVDQSVYSDGEFRLFDNFYNLGMTFSLDNREGQGIKFQWLGGGEGNEYIYDRTSDWSAGDLVHLAVSWDISGIDETGETMRIFVNGDKTAGTSNILKTISVADIGEHIFFGNTRDVNQSPNFNTPLRGVIDNLKIYNYAKSDFSDRFYEDGAPADDPNVKVRVRKLSKDKKTGILTKRILIKNISGELLYAPIKAVVYNISDPRVSVLDPDGFTEDGRPYIEFTDVDIPAGFLLPKEKSPWKPVSFSNGALYPFTFAVEVLYAMNDPYEDPSFYYADISDYASYTVKKSKRRKKTGVLTQKIYVKNTSDMIMLPPIKVIIYNITDPNVSVMDPDGMTADGRPYIEFTAGDIRNSDYLRPGKRTIAKKVFFANGARYPFEYDTEIFAFRQDISTTGTVDDPSEETVIRTEEAELVIPAGAADEGTAVKITKVEDPEGIPDNIRGASAVYKFETDGYIFKEPVIVKIGYNAAAIPSYFSASNLRIFSREDAGGEWTALKVNELNTAGHWISSAVTHFSEFIVGTLSLPSAPEHLNVNPNARKEEPMISPLDGITSVKPPQGNNYGNAAVNYPFSIPPGRAGMSPEVVLTYSGSKGNGVCGIGWDIAFDSIRRSAKNGVPLYDHTDVFTHAGVELVETDSGAGYREFFRKTEDGAFLRYRYFSSGDYWTVADKNGKKMYFGQTENSRENGQTISGDRQGSFLWALTRVEDLNGNFMEYAYLKNSERAFLDEIRYTGNTVTSDDPAFKVRFSYASRDDGYFTTEGGIDRGVFLKMSAVAVYYGLDEVNSYDLTYEQSPSSFRTRLRSVTDNRTGYATTFNYEGDSRTFMYKEGPLSPPGITFMYSKTGDFNGDGRMDFMTYTGYQDGNDPDLWVVHYATEDKDFIAKEYNTLLAVDTRHFQGGVRTGDFDGDGKTDLLIYHHANVWNVYYSTGDGFEVAAHTIGGLSADADLSRVKLGDFNGDGRTDFMQWTGNAGYWAVAYSYGRAGWDVEIYDVQLGVDPNYIQSGVRTGDFNGDGKTDLTVYMFSGYWNIYYSTGSGFVVAQHYLGIDAGADLAGVVFGDFDGDGKTDVTKGKMFSNYGYMWTVAYARRSGFTRRYTFVYQPAPEYEDNVMTGDFNGDGKTDLLAWREGYWSIWYSKGYVPDTIGIGFEHSTVGLDGLVPGYAPEHLKAQIRLGDFDGDGKTDVLRIGQPVGEEIMDYAVSYYNSSYCDMLTSIENPTNSVKIQYSHSGLEPDNLGLHFPVTLMSSYLLRAGTDEYITRLDYQNGVYDMEAREFRGFGYLRITDAEDNYVEKLFSTDEYLSGKQCGQKKYDSTGLLLSEKQTIWEAQDLQDGRYFTKITGRLAGKYADDYVNTYSGSVDQGGWKRYKISYDYDDHGNLVEVTNYGEVNYDENDDDLDEADNVIEYTEFQDDTENWVFTAVERGIKDHNGFILKRNFYEYSMDGRYNLEREEFELRDGANPFTVKAYDDYGNIIRQTDVRGHDTVYEYDTETHSYQTKMLRLRANGYKHDYTAENLYDVTTGKVLYSKGIDGLTTRYEYDPLKRLSKIIVTGDTDERPTVEYEYYPDEDPPKSIARYRHENASDMTIDKYLYCDGLGRVIQIKRPYDDGTGLMKWIAEQTVEFDSMGRVQREGRPEVDTTPEYSELAVRNPVEYFYDALGRKKKILLANGASTEIIYGNNWELYVDPLGYGKKKVFDAFDNVTGIIEYYSETGEEYVTRYEYDLLGQLKEVTDNEGNSILIEYDSLGRKTVMSDPGMGLWRYAYDAAGNTVWQKDAKGEEISFIYDALNRLTIKDYADPGVQDVTFSYDDYDGSLSGGSMGRLTRVVDGSGVITYEYDIKGNIINETRAVASGGTYTQGLAYDSAGKLTGMVYPDGEGIVYEYDGAGLLSSVKNTGGRVYINDIRYNEFGQITSKVYGNGTVIEYIYDDITRRLKNVKTTRDGVLYQDMIYEFDDSGNVKKLRDNVNNATTEYEYDSLYRLSKYVYQDPEDSFVRNYVYSSIGNILFKENVGTYLYGENGAGPHAVTSAGPYRFFYDENGNMRTKEDTESGEITTFEWDIENRLLSVNNSVSGDIAEFIYDYRGKRVKKINPVSGNTIYPNAYYEIHNGITTKHVFVGDRRTVSLQSDGSAYWYHTDHLGSTSIVTDESGEVVQEVGYFPYGEARKEKSEVTNYLFTGQEIDRETGLYYYGARYYDPEIGRFISADTIVPNLLDPQSLNRYSYVRNNPVIYTDPSGHFFSILIDIFEKIVHFILTGEFDVEEFFTDIIEDVVTEIVTGGLGAVAEGIGLVADAAGEVILDIVSGYVTDVFKEASENNWNFIDQWANPDIFKKTVMRAGKTILKNAFKEITSAGDEETPGAESIDKNSEDVVNKTIKPEKTIKKIGKALKVDKYTPGGGMAAMGATLLKQAPHKPTFWEKLAQQMKRAGQKLIRTDGPSGQAGYTGVRG